MRFDGRRWLALATLLLVFNVLPATALSVLGLPRLMARGVQIRNQGSPSIMDANPQPDAPIFYSVYITDANLFDSQATYNPNLYSYSEWQSAYQLSEPPYYAYSYSFPSPAEYDDYTLASDVEIPSFTSSSFSF